MGRSKEGLQEAMDAWWGRTEEEKERLSAEDEAEAMYAWWGRTEEEKERLSTEDEAEEMFGKKLSNIAQNPNDDHDPIKIAIDCEDISKAKKLN